jgi:hypothetical protein
MMPHLLDLFGLNGNLPLAELTLFGWSGAMAGGIDLERQKLREIY